MGRYTPGARIWVDLVALAAVVATLLAGNPLDADSRGWVELALLASCAAIAHVFPIRSASNGVTYQVTNVFLVAAALTLPRELLTLLPVVALSADTWQQRRRPGTAFRWIFNVSQTVLAVHAAAELVR